jgi:hypothetical protein
MKSRFVFNVGIGNSNPTLSVVHNLIDFVSLQLFGSAICGNGFVEEGEQCDCGTQEVQNCQTTV